MALDNEIVVLKTVEQYVTESKDSLDSIAKNIEKNIEKLRGEARFFLNWLNNEYLQQLQKLSMTLSSSTFKSQLSNLKTVIYEDQTFKQEVFKKALKFKEIYNETLKRKSAAALIMPDGKIKVLSQKKMSDVIAESSLIGGGKNAPLTRNGNIRIGPVKTTLATKMQEAQQTLDGQIADIGEHITRITNIYSPIYDLSLVRYDNKNMDYKSAVRSDDYPQDDTKTYYWWMDQSTNFIAASSQIKNRGYIGEIYLAYILSQEDSSLPPLSVTGSNISDLITRQSFEVEKALQGMSNYIGNQDDLSAAIQEDLIIRFNGSRWQIAVKALHKGTSVKNRNEVSSKISSESLNPLIAIAIFIDTYSDTNKEQFARLLARLFYRDFERNLRTKNRAQSILDYALQEANKEFNKNVNISTTMKDFKFNLDII